jgi:hypothetical protein
MNHLEVIELWNKSGRTFQRYVSKSHFFANTFSLAVSIKKHSQSILIIMAKENLSELSTDDLTKKKKQTRFVMGLLTGALIMAIFLTIISKGFSYLNIIPFACSPILFIVYKTLSDINKELKSRNSN